MLASCLFGSNIGSTAWPDPALLGGVRAPTHCDDRRCSCAHDRRRAARSRRSQSPCRDIGNDAAAIFVRADIEDRDIAFAEQTAQGIARGLRHLQFLRTGRLQFRRVDAAQADPRGQVEARRQMHPRLERVAIDGPDHIDGMAHIGIAGAFPYDLRVARRRTVRAKISRGGRARAPNAARAAWSPPRPRARTPTAAPPKIGAARRAWPVSIYSLIWVHIPNLRLSWEHGKSPFRTQKSEAMPLRSQSP